MRKNLLKRRIVVLLVVACLCAVFVAPVQALNGFVGGAQWAEAQRVEIIRRSDASLNLITQAQLAWRINRPQHIVMLGFVVHVPSVENSDPVGAVLLLSGREIGRWQHGLGVRYDSVNYSLRGAAWFPGAEADHYSFVLELGWKNPTAFEALRNLQVQMVDPAGSTTQTIALPMVFEEPPVVELPTEMATDPPPPPPPVVTTTTTTRPPTTARTTTTRATTTRTSTTRATLTFANAPAPQVPVTLQQEQPVAQQPVQSPATQPAALQANTPRFSVVTTWHTVIYNEAPAEFAEHPTLYFADAPPPDVPQQPQAPLLPVEHEPQAMAQLPAARNNTLLYAAGALLGALAAALVVFWILAQRKKPNEANVIEEN